MEIEISARFVPENGCQRATRPAHVIQRTWSQPRSEMWESGWPSIKALVPGIIEKINETSSLQGKQVFLGLAIHHLNPTEDHVRGFVGSVPGFSELWDRLCLGSCSRVVGIPVTTPEETTDRLAALLAAMTRIVPLGIKRKKNDNPEIITDPLGTQVPPDWQDFFKHKPHLLVLDNGYGQNLMYLPTEAVKFRGAYHAPHKVLRLPPREFHEREKIALIGDPDVVVCDECGSMRHRSGRCGNCDRDQSGPHGYHCDCFKCKSVIRFPDDKADDEQLLGAELELNGIFDYSKFFTDRSTVQHDGSICSLGGEIITSPMTFDEHVGFWNERREAGAFIRCHSRIPVYKKRRNQWHKMPGDNYEHTHGLHVHVNRKTLDQARWEILAEAMMRIFPHLVAKVGGRGDGRYRSFNWASIQSSLPQRCAGDYHGNAINPRRKTVEMRFPKSSSNPNVVIGRIGFIDSLVSFAKEEIDPDRHEDIGIGSFRTGPCGFRHNMEDMESRYLKYLKGNHKKWPMTHMLSVMKQPAK